MLRWLVLALLLANALFWAWRQGWLGPSLGLAPAGQREPARLQQQVRPESVRVLPAGGAASGAGAGPIVGMGPTEQAAVMPVASAPAGSGAAAGPATPALACLESGPLAPSGLEAAEQVLAAVLPERAWIRASRDATPQYAVVLGPLAGRDAIQKKREELGRLRLGMEELRLPGNGGTGLALGRYETRAAAQAALEGFSQRGVRTARVLALREAGSELRLRMENLAPEQAEALRSLKSPALGEPGLVACSMPAPSSR